MRAMCTGYNNSLSLHNPDGGDSVLKRNQKEILPKDSSLSYF